MSRFSVIRHSGWGLPGEVAPRDPFTIGAAIVTAVSQATGVALAFEAFVVASTVIGTVAVGAAIGGVQYALSKTLTDKARASGIGGGNVYGVNAPEVRGNVNQSAPAQRIPYGHARIGGAVCFLDDSKPPYLYLGLLHSARRIGAVRALHIGTNEVRFRDIGFNDILVPLANQSPNYASNLRVSFRDGHSEQAIDPLLAAEFPNLDSSFRQRGIATSVYEFAYGADREAFEALWGQVSVPNPLIDVEGARVYDPRDPTQRYPDDWRDRDDVANAIASWTFSNTAALVQADWLGYPQGLNYPLDRIRWDEIGRAADFDEELVGNADGTLRKRHAIDGLVTLDQSPQDIAEAMATANRGFFVQSRGRGWVRSSAPRDPVLTIADGMLLDGFEFRDDRAKRDVYNTVSARFSSSDREYQDIDGPVHERADLVASDGEVLPVQVRLPLTSDHRAVQQLEKQFLEESRLPRALTCLVPVTARRLDVGDCVRVASRTFPRMDGLYSVEDCGFLEDFSALQLSLVEYDPGIAKAWDPASDERAFALPALDVS